MSNANTAWILTSTALVLFMTLPGLALFYAGLVRSKNTISVLAQCLVIAVLASVVWFVLGYSLSFSGEGSYIGNLDKIFLKTVNLKSLSGDIPETVFVMFQMTFAIITPALIVGAFVERMKFSAVVLFTVLWLILVYAPATHWVWGGGWLAKMGVFDFAGGLVVHTTAGVSALVIAYSLGSRKDFPKNFNPPHSPVLAMIGACMLWVGWFGFNAGSALAANENAGMAMLVTHISAATATITWMFIDWIKNGKPGLVGMITGMIAGLATITPASGFVGPMGAIILGILAGSICYYCVGFVKLKLHIDDSLDVFAVHGVGGIIGTLLAGILATDFFGGVGLEKSALEQTMIQVIGILTVALLSFVGTVIIIKIIKLTTGLRVSEDEETGEGLDFGSHGESSYNL
ncbi:ammonium transporter [Pelagibacteraceae bacterium]|jgi:Amt family ammonium transporter|uniref:ammonium transporter n=1 Tax=Pelagibacter sp. (strain IMCC9063) TaxID=1002672 RepID=UPI000204662F|nr:ammonium transporter [Candidatus Pelagibacter sp. IMCC9063]AEA81325.1 ammonium transporter [Candidatus Pelagibacter sp. IMCC9063]MDB4022846.1 ammonium transporter [Pelagibacteraceae bacterium]